MSALKFKANRQALEKMNFAFTRPVPCLSIVTQFGTNVPMQQKDSLILSIIRQLE